MDSCTETADDCKCVHSGPHDVHECKCGAKWTGTYGTDEWHPVDYPLIGGIDV